MPIAPRQTRLPTPPPILPRYPFLPASAIAARVVFVLGPLVALGLLWSQLGGREDAREQSLLLFGQLRFVPVLALLNLPAFVFAPGLVVPTRTLSGRQCLAISLGPLLLAIGVGLVRLSADAGKLAVLGSATVPSVLAVLWLAFLRRPPAAA